MSFSSVGIGLKHKHFQEILASRPPVGWFEVHSENFFNLFSPAAKYLEKIREIYPISMHGVGLSLGSADGLDKNHLAKLKTAIDHFKPFLVSEHISWGAAGNIHTNDLLPLPCTKESLNVISDNIKQTQDFLGRQILVENPSSYLQFENDEMPEWEFVSRVAEDSGCGLILDINNIYVSATNHNFSAQKYIEFIPAEFVKEIHLAGYSESTIEGEKILIDTHGNKVFEPVWDLYEHAIDKLIAAPTLIEWDTDIPALNVLLAEAKKAEQIISKNKAA